MNSREIWAEIEALRANPAPADFNARLAVLRAEIARLNAAGDELSEDAVALAYAGEFQGAIRREPRKA